MKKILDIVDLLPDRNARLGTGRKMPTRCSTPGQSVDYTQMMDVLERQDVVFIGEIHNCPIAHWMEYEIVKDLYDRHATG